MGDKKNVGSTTDKVDCRGDKMVSKNTIDQAEMFFAMQLVTKR